MSSSSQIRDLRDDWAAFADLHEASSSTSLLTSLEEVRSSSFKNTEENGEQSPGSDSMPYKTLFQTEDDDTAESFLEIKDEDGNVIFRKREKPSRR
mmetsp:Transcript_4556/g.16599  ORF Transcript_4556/g.16599 Transcript_4556/m.16599 type:complete len:96 (-) Transcript_4556:96-383(-)